MPRIVGALAAQIALVIVLLLGGLAIHVYRTHPRPARALVERELRGGILTEGEHVSRIVTVFRRRPSDYFRATRGILALTDHRLVYVGIAPRDIMGPEDPVPAIESRDFPLDTTLRASPGHALLGATRAVVLAQGGEREAFGVADEDWQDADAILRELEARHAAQRAEAARLRREAAIADSIARAPKWHVVARGQALSTIATMYGTTVEQLRALNNLTSDRIKVGQRLLVKPQT
ncbi:MAG TPA: LysM peptidoglycan-binding domain-containing protein [Gemmatimonadaceae bacterium]